MAVVVSDWEGEFVTDDNARDVTAEHIPGGDRLFPALSNYNVGLLGGGREPGDTLSLLMPLFIAYELKEDNFHKGGNFIDGSVKALEHLKNNGGMDIISTSYRQYMNWICLKAGLSKGAAYCTELPLEFLSKNVSEDDKKLVREEINYIIVLMEQDDRAPLKNEFDNFFFHELPKTSFPPLDSVKPVGGKRKLAAAKQILEKKGKEMQEAIMIGDSITDRDMLKACRDAGGAAVSFNGNSHAIKNANISVVSYNSMAIPVTASLFERGGMKTIEKVAGEWAYDRIKKEMHANSSLSLLYSNFSDSYARTMAADGGAELPRIEIITKDNIEDIIGRSEYVRKRVRGVAIGSLV